MKNLIIFLLLCCWINSRVDAIRCSRELTLSVVGFDPQSVVPDSEVECGETISNCIREEASEPFGQTGLTLNYLALDCATEQICNGNCGGATRNLDPTSQNLTFPSCQTACCTRNLCNIQSLDVLLSSNNGSTNQTGQPATPMTAGTESQSTTTTTQMTESQTDSTTSIQMTSETTTQRSEAGDEMDADSTTTSTTSIIVTNTLVVTDTTSGTAKGTYLHFDLILLASVFSLLATLLI